MYVSESYPAYVLSGFIVGLLFGLTGVGGGALMTPLLILLFNINPMVAVGTDLLYACITKAVGTIVHGYNLNIEWRIVGRLAVGSLPASLGTILVFNLFLHDRTFAGSLINSLLGIALLGTAFALIFKTWLIEAYNTQLGSFSQAHAHRLTILMGIILGIFVTITSVGAGALCVTALALLYPSMPIVRIAATDLAHAVPLTLLAALGYLFAGDIDFFLMGALLTGSVPGILIASYFAGRLPDLFLRWILALILLLLGLKFTF